VRLVLVAPCDVEAAQERVAKKGHSSLFLLLHFFFFGATTFFNALIEGFLLEPAGRPMFDDTNPW
jgi:hypothetical protein